MDCAFNPAACRMGIISRLPAGRTRLLLGDAAGLADPFLGEGIYYAHRSAQLAADAILETRSRPESAMQAYRSRFLRILYPELRYARAARRLIFSLPPRLYYPFLNLLLRATPKVWEETIQGQRTFRWLKKLNTMRENQEFRAWMGVSRTQLTGAWEKPVQRAVKYLRSLDVAQVHGGRDDHQLGSGDPLMHGPGG